jgi:hypothetical protein
LLAGTRCRLNPLVVKRLAPNGQLVASEAIVAGREASGNNARHNRLAMKRSGIASPS